MEDRKKPNRSVGTLWPKVLVTLCVLCFMALSASAQQGAGQQMQKNENGELVPVPAPVYYYNGQPIELSPEKLAGLEALLLQQGLNPADVLKDKTDITQYLDAVTGNGTVAPVLNPENEIGTGSLDPGSPQ